MQLSASRRSWIRGAVTVLAVGSLGVAAAVSARTGSATSKSPTPLVVKQHAQPHELATMLALIDLSPEVLAAAGVTISQCDGIFDAAYATCIQADRLTQFQIAHRNLNGAKALAAMPPSRVEPRPGDPLPTVQQAQDALDNLKASTYQFVTTGLDQGQRQLLTTIRNNIEWGIATPYLTVDRTGLEWMRLRGALSDQRRAQEIGETLREAATQIISEADGNGTVAAAKLSYASLLEGLKTTWATRSQTVPVP